MPRVSLVHTLDAEGLAALLEPRDDVVLEQVADGDRYHLVQADGPFEHYERSIEVLDGGEVRETVDFTFPPWTWRPLLNLAMRHTLRHPPKPGTMPWWAASQRMDPRSAQVLGLCATLAVVAGYVGTLLSQTMTFAADEFDISKTAQGNVLAAARIGGVLAISLTAAADRLGRRRMLRASLLTCIAANVLGAVTPNLFGLAVSQIVNRGAWAAAAILLGIMIAEEMPAGARAYAVSLVAMTGALGAGIALWVLPVADYGLRAWRILYIVPLAMLPLVIGSCRRLPESKRYVTAHRSVPLGEHRGRLLLLASTAFLLNVFVAPTTQFRPEFLRDDRGFSAGGLALFTVITSTPAGIGILAGGRLADTMGRRVVGSISIALGVAVLALQFAIGGVAMWAAATLGGIIFAAHVPSITVYGPELFPTSLRGRANGIISLTAMAGGVVGLSAAGVMTDAFGTFAPTFAILAVAPMIMALLIATRFPETARRELEDINPDDQGVPTPLPLLDSG